MGLILARSRLSELSEHNNSRTLIENDVSLYTNVAANLFLANADRVSNL